MYPICTPKSAWGTNGVQGYRYGEQKEPSGR
nr:MAG TPA: hypothetical protein [Caudoviricetes sp.]